MERPIANAECSIGFALKPIPRETLFLAWKDFLQYKWRKGENGKLFTKQSFLR